MAEAEPNAEPEVVTFQLEETFVMPVGIQVNKQDTPEGPVVFIKFIEGVPVGPGAMMPLRIRSYKLTPNQANELVGMITGGIHLAKAHEIPK
jgi:hypothetical protein